MYGLLGALLGLHGRLGKGPMLLYILVVTGGGWGASPLSLPCCSAFLPLAPSPSLLTSGGGGRSVEVEETKCFLFLFVVSGVEN